MATKKYSGLVRFFNCWITIICLSMTAILPISVQARQTTSLSKPMTPFLLLQDLATPTSTASSKKDTCAYSGSLESMQSCFEQHETDEFPVIWSWVLLIAVAAAAPLLLISIFTIDTIVFAGLVAAWLVWDILTTMDYNNKREDLYKKFEALSKEKVNVQLEALQAAVISSRQSAEHAKGKAMKLSILSYAMFGLGIATGVCAAAIFPWLRFFCTGPGSIGSLDASPHHQQSIDTVSFLKSPIKEKTLACQLNSPFDDLLNGPFTSFATSPMMTSSLSSLPLIASKLNILFPKVEASDEKEVEKSVLKYKEKPENSYFLKNILLPLGIGGGAAAAVLLVAYDAVMGFLGPVLKIVWVRAGIYAAVGILAQVAKGEIEGAAQQFQKDRDTYQKILVSYKTATAKKGLLKDGSNDPDDLGNIEGDAPEKEWFHLERPSHTPNGRSSDTTGCHQFVKGKIVPDPKCSCKPNCKIGRRYKKPRTKKGHWASSPLNHINEGFETMNSIGHAAANGQMGKIDSLAGGAEKQATRIHGAVGKLESGMNNQREKEGKKPIHLLKEGSGAIKKLHNAVKKAVSKLPKDQRGTVDPFGRFRPLSGTKHAGSGMTTSRTGNDFLRGQSGNKYLDQFKTTEAGKKGAGGIYNAINDFFGGSKDNGQGSGSGDDSFSEDDASIKEELTDSSIEKDLKSGNWNKGDIHQNSSLSIFKILSQRYLKSAYPRLLLKKR